MISLYTSGLTKPVGFLFCFPFQGVENHIPSQQTQPDLHSGMQLLPPNLFHQCWWWKGPCGTLALRVWTTRLSSGRGKWDILDELYPVAAGSGQSKGLHLRKDKLPCNAPTCRTNSCGRSCPDTSQGWAGALGTSVSGWWIWTVPNCTGKMRRLPTGCTKPDLTSGNVQ